MPYVALNNAASTLSGGVTAVDTAISVQIGHGAKFAVGANYSYLTLQDASSNIEIVKLTSVTGDVLNVVRAQDGTAARVWGIGDTIGCRPCAAAFNDFAVALQVNTSTSKATPVDADELGLTDSAASFGLKKLTWANLKSTLVTYFNTLFTKVDGSNATGTWGINTTGSAATAPTTTPIKLQCRAATTANITLAGSAPNTLDGVTLAANYRILVKDQSTGSQNGLYYVSTLGTGSNGTWTRAADADGAGDMFGGMLVSVSEGTANGNSLWMLTTDDPITIGTTALTFLKPYADKGMNADITSMTALTAPTVAANPIRATDLQVQLATAFTTGGTSTAFTLTPTPASAANTTNQRFRINFNAAAGSTPTLAVSGQTAKSLKYKDSTGTKQAITATQVPSGWVSDVEYDGTDWVVLNVLSFGKSIGANGYSKIGDGLTLQWGVVVVTTGTPFSLTFPIAFSTAIYSLTLGLNSPSGAGNTVYSNAVTTSGASISVAGTAGSSNVYWMAMGI